MRLLSPVTKASLLRSTLTSNVDRVDIEETCCAKSSFLNAFMIVYLCHIGSYSKQIFVKCCEMSPPSVTRLETCHAKVSVAKDRIFKQFLHMYSVFILQQHRVQSFPLSIRP